MISITTSIYIYIERERGKYRRLEVYRIGIELHWREGWMKLKMGKCQWQKKTNPTRQTCPASERGSKFAEKHEQTITKCQKLNSDPILDKRKKMKKTSTKPLLLLQWEKIMSPNLGLYSKKGLYLL